MEKEVKLLLVSIFFMSIFLVLMAGVRADLCQDFCGLGWGGAWCKSGCAGPGIYCDCDKILWWCVDSTITDCSEHDCCIPIGFSKCGTGQYYNKIITGYTKLCNVNTGACTRERIDSVHSCGNYHSHCGYDQQGNPYCYCDNNWGNCDNNWENGCECPPGKVCEGTSCVSPCNCGNWIARSCGGGNCASTQRLYTRTCTPPGCEYENKCVSDSSCEGAPPLECSQYNDWVTMKRYNGIHSSCNPASPPAGDVCVRDDDGDSFYDQYCQNGKIKNIEIIGSIT